jgi:hypothetical protein
MASNRLWGQHLPEQLTGSTMNRQFGLQLRDPPVRRGQLGVLGAGGARQPAGVDQVLPPPGIDRLLADP